MAEPKAEARKRIHILGIGSIGMLVAHSLRGIPDPPPVTLLFHRIAYAKDWQDGRQEITLVTEGQEDARSGFDSEMAIPSFRRHDKIVSAAEAERLDNLSREDIDEGSRLDEQIQELPDDEIFELNKGPPIHNVIVTVKAPATVSALSAIKHRLSADSTILFLQNGMGIIEEVNEQVFPNPLTRPHYLLGINSHGVNSQKSFVATHAGFGTISLGMPVRRLSKAPSPALLASDEYEDGSSNYNDVDMAPSSRYLLRTLTRVPVLAAVGFSPTDLLKAQLDKLAVNCILNPLTALLDCRNGMLLYNMAMTRCMRLLLSEVSSIFIRLPELQGLPNTNTRFSPERLETLAVGVANKTGQNISSMLADVRRGNQTEIEYINGYVVKRGEELGIHAGFNYMVQQLVRGKQQMVHLSDSDDLPFVGEP